VPDDQKQPGTRARDGKGKYVRTTATAERDAAAAELRAQGRKYDEIAAELGFADRGEAHHAVQRALQAIVREPAERLRDLELSRLDAMYEAAMGVLERQHVTVSNGKVIHFDGAPLVDDAPVLAAIDRLLRIQERRAKLFGLDAPARVSVDAENLGREINDLLGVLTPGNDDDDDSTGP
jgi:hypothetical protein